MICTACKYVLNSFDLTCPRCGWSPNGVPQGKPPAPAISTGRTPVNTTAPTLGTSPGAEKQVEHLSANQTFAWVSLILAGTGVWIWLSVAQSPSPTPSAPTDSGTVVVVQKPEEAVQIPTGPTFEEVDRTMDDRRLDLTDAQRQQYWGTVAGTQVTWTGILHNAYLNGGGEISMQCNPNSVLSDVRVNLDGSQRAELPKLRKGQRITIRAILSDHRMFGYQLEQGQIVF